MAFLPGISHNLIIRKGNLPHWQLGGMTYFVTFRSIRGPLPDNAKAQVMKNCLHDHGKRIDLYFGLVMPDHVHLILQPREKSPGVWFDLALIMHGIKGVSSKAINKILKTEGTLWQPESFDRIIRNEKEFLEKLNYIWMNPVKAGLVERSELYPYFMNPMNVISIPKQKCPLADG